MTTGDRRRGLPPSGPGLYIRSTFSHPERIVPSVAENTSPAAPNDLLRVIVPLKAEWDMPGTLSPGASFLLGAARTLENCLHG